MHTNLVLAICLAGLQMVVGSPVKHPDGKPEWIKDISAVKGRSAGVHHLPDGIEKKKGHPKVHKGPPMGFKHPHEVRDPEAEAEPEAEPAVPAGYGKRPKPAAYKKMVLQSHNVHRTNHSAPKITWSDSLAATAQKIASGCVFAHVMGTDGGGYGQNIAAGAPDNAITHVISDQFYNSEINSFGDQYGQPSPTGFESWGHFSQVIWKGTQNVGCATQYCPNGVGNTGSNVPPWFTVCNYSPPGNFANQYGDNVGTPLGRATVRGHGANGQAY